MKTRVEIFKNDTWVPLVLKEDKIKYNTVCNKIGQFEQRKISGSNTFSLPYVSENIIALDINVFSPVLMAESLNRKYPARYYVRDKLLQKGYLVINNTLRGDINVNFIDEALVITDEWGLTTFKQLLHNLGENPSIYPKSVISSSFMDNINILKNYETDKSKKVLNTPACFCDGDDESIDGKNVYITRYPNPLNNIGDKFNLDTEGIRKPDSFNPFQSRPIFSQFSFLYIVCQAFGYKLRLDSSVDFELLRDTYLTNKGVEENTPLKDSTVESLTPIISSMKPNWRVHNSFFEANYEFIFNYPNTSVTIDSFGRKIGVASKTPIEIGNYNPSHTYGDVRVNPKNQKCVVLIESNFLGEVVWTGEVSPTVPNGAFNFVGIYAKSVWKKSDNSVIEVNFTIESEMLENPNRKYSFKATGDKGQLNNTPLGATSFIGLTLHVLVRHIGSQWNDAPSLINLHFVEKVLKSGTVSFDTFGQYVNNRTNLLDLAPDTSVKELLSNVLQQQGLLLTFERDSNGIQNIAKIFTYGSYRNRVSEARLGEPNKYYDWSQYFQRNVPPLWNTDYGTDYGEMNEISLTNPFPGNIGRIKISTNVTSKGFKSKLVPLKQNQTKMFEDISSVILVLNTNPYFEYTLKNQGLVKCSFNQYLPGTRKQYNAELSTSIIDCDPLPQLSNVIYSDDFLPVGVKEWYYLVDVAVRCQATFLLPILVIQTLDLSKPVYIETLGGFYIVEEVEEYTDNLTTVKVNLIKLPLTIINNIVTPDYLQDNYSSDYAN